MEIKEFAVKDTNPKDALGIKKAPTSTVPGRVMFELGLAMLEGARKYGRHNYRVIGVKASVYVDAAMRHLWSFFEGEDIDSDSGLHHLIKAMACIAVLRDAQHMGVWTDDRPPTLPGGLNLTELNELAKKIIEKYPDAKPPYTQANEVVIDENTKCDDCVQFGYTCAGKRTDIELKCFKFRKVPQ